MNTNQTETFEYSYSAKQAETAKAIREKYLPKEQDAIEQLQKLDKSVTKKGMIVSLVVGIISALVLGTGMSMIMEWSLFVPGIIVGLIGIIGCGIAYPLYLKVTAKEKAKITPEIMRLSEEIINGK